MISKLSIPMLLFSFFLFFPNGEEGLVQNPAASQHQNWESNPALLTPMPQASSARQECWSCLNNGIISARLVKAQKWVILFHHPLHEFQWGCCIYLQMTGEVACNIGYFLFQLLGFGVGLFWSHKFKKKKESLRSLGPGLQKYFCHCYVIFLVACTHDHFKETLAIEVKHRDHMQTG